MRLRRASRYVHDHLLWFLLAVYAIAVFVPAPGLWIRNQSFGDYAGGGERIHVSLLMLMLALLMFNAGLGLRAEHLTRLRKRQRVLLAGLVANVAIPVAYIFGVSLVMRLWHNPMETQHILVGLALVAAMPIAGTSTAWAQNSNGNLAVSLGLVLFSTLLSPIVTPQAFLLIGEMTTEEYEAVLHGLSSYSSGIFLGLWVVAPAMLGLGMRWIVPEARLAAVLPLIKAVNAADLLLLNYSNAAVSLPQAIAQPDLDFLAVTLAITTGLCLTAFGTGYILSRLFELDRGERVSLMYALGMNNNGTGLVLASLVLASYPRVMVPIIFYNLVQHIVAGAVHELMGRETLAPYKSVR